MYGQSRVIVGTDMQADMLNDKTFLRWKKLEFANSFHDIIVRLQYTEYNKTN